MGADDATPEPLPAGERPMREELRSNRAKIIGRLVFLAIMVVSLYILWPSLIKVFSSAPQLLTIEPWWFAVMLGVEIVSFACIWALLRIALGTSRWFAIAGSQLAGNAFSRIVPGGAAAGGALQYRMLIQARFEATRVGTGLTAASLISTATIFALPILTLPTILFGAPVASGLSQAALLGAAAFVVFVGLGAVLLTSDRALELLGLGLQRGVDLFRRRRPRRTDLPARLLRERNEIRSDLGEDWWKALLAAAGNWVFDYLALLAALTAVGAQPRPSLTLLAYVSAVVLGMIPITPGGLGFVEAGLTATLVLAGVSGPDATLATLAYRLVSYWLPIVIGPVAYLFFARRYRGAEPEAATSG